MKSNAQYEETKFKAVPNGWKHSYVNDIAKLKKNSFTPSADNNLPYVGLEHINQGSLSLNGVGNSSDVISNKYYFNRGDILFGKLRPYFRKVFQPKFDGVCSTDIWVVEPKEGNDGTYLFYFMANEDFVSLATAGSTGTRMPRANWNQIKNSQWYFPQLTEQQQIASILSSLDDKIELNRRMNKTLEELGKALFKRWFVDFEFPNENGEPYKSSGGEMVEDELGLIPKGWNASRVGEIATLKSGFAFKGSSFKDSGKYGVIKIKNVIDPGVDVMDIQFVSEEEVKDSARQFILNSGDILIAMSGNTTGKIGILVKGDYELVLNQRVGKYFLKNTSYHWYLYFLLRSGDIQKSIVEKAYGSAQPNISPSLLEDITLLIPDNNVLKKFNDISSHLMKSYIKNYTEKIKLIKLRDSLLPRLMSGRIRVN